MSKLSRWIAVFSVIFLSLALIGCFQPVDLEEMRDEAEKRLNGATGPGGPSSIPDGSPKLGVVQDTGSPRPINATETINLNGANHPFSIKIIILNPTAFTGGFTWTMNTYVRTGEEFEVNPAAPGSPFSSPGNYMLTVVAFDTDGAPQSAYVTINVVRVEN